MPKDRRSFFEKLTGSVSVSEDQDEEFFYQQPQTNQEEDWEHGFDPEEESEDEDEEGELSVDVYQTPNEIIIQTMVAGVRPEDLDINISRESVTIKGRRDRPGEPSPGDYFHKELYWGPFARNISLPAEVETEEADAIEKHGLLTIVMPKVDKDRTQKLRVRTGSQ